MKKHVLLTTLMSILLLQACNHPKQDSCSDTICEFNPSEPVLVRITKSADGTPQVTPETFVAIPGQEVIFMGKEDFDVYFIGISPTNPSQRKGKRDFPSEDNDVKLTISKDFTSDLKLPEFEEVIGDNMDYVLKMSGVENSEIIMKKRPRKTEKYVEFNYAITINGIVLDPKGKVKFML